MASPIPIFAALEMPGAFVDAGGGMLEVGRDFDAVVPLGVSDVVVSFGLVDVPVLLGIEEVTPVPGVMKVEEELIPEVTNLARSVICHMTGMPIPYSS